MVAGDGPGPAVAAGVRLDLRHRRDVVGATGDEQQRGPVAVGEVDPDRGSRVEVGQCGLEQHSPGAGHVVTLVDPVGLLAAHGVGEGVVELLGGQRHRLTPVGQAAQDRERDPQGRERQPQHPLDRGGVDGHGGGAEPPVGQHLGERPAEGVAHDDRRPVQAPDDPVVVVDDPGDVEFRDRRRVPAELLDLPVHAGPGGCEHPEARRGCSGRSTAPSCAASSTARGSARWCRLSCDRRDCYS